MQHKGTHWSLKKPNEIHRRWFISLFLQSHKWRTTDQFIIVLMLEEPKRCDANLNYSVTPFSETHTKTQAKNGTYRQNRRHWYECLLGWRHISELELGKACSILLLGLCTSCSMEVMSMSKGVWSSLYGTVLLCNCYYALKNFPWCRQQWQYHRVSPHPIVTSPYPDTLHGGAGR